MIKNVCYWLCAVLLLAVGCSKEKTYTISGTWEEGDGRVAYLKKEIGEKQFQILDSAIVVNGKFQMKGVIPKIDMRKLVIGKDEQDILLDEVPIQVTATQMTNKQGEKIDSWDLEIKGSPEQDVIRETKSLSMGKSLMTLGGMFAMMKVKDDSVKLDSTYKAWRC